MMMLRITTRTRRATHRVLTALSLGLAVVAPTTTSAQASSRARLVARIDSIANAAVKNGPVAGLSVAVVKGRDTIVQKGYGFADVENEVPATGQTVYRIGSITKQFTSAAIMQLVEQGKITLDDTLGKLLPAAPPAWSGVTLRRLLNHTSGIRSYTGIGPRWQ